ncbi:MAG: pyridoxal phosphate-dependent aminotransferase [Candidatus Electrothrix sp. AR4]|nr:pyridoxal phosphate-dependent aminotransferase [Candidatus Electrothrix sp. AR4]
MGGQELNFVHDAFASNYIAPIGPQVDAFEQEFADLVGAKYAAAVSSGTAALHLLLRYSGVTAGDVVFCSTFTFIGSANPILYQGASPVFIDSDVSSWNMDPNLLNMELEQRAAANSLPKAMILVHLYGQPADIDPIKAVCDTHGVILIEDAAEALGAKYKGETPGTFGLAGFYSFNGNKIITTSGGGMIVSDDEALIQKIKFWATQAKDNAVHYQHSEIGYNYRMSNVLAGIGRGQLRVLADRVEKKREIFAYYREHLSDLPGIDFMPEPAFARSTRWLTCLTIDPNQAGVSRDAVIQELENDNIESRPTWKPMHMQPLYAGCATVGGQVAEELFSNGLCLPSGTSMSAEEQHDLVRIVRSCWKS